MRSKRICVYRVDDPATAALGDYKVVATPENRQELRTVIGGEKIDVLIIDLDASDALDAVVEVLEINTSIAVVGVLAGNDVQKFIAAQRAGCRQVACKPLNENDLAMAVRKSLNEANSQVDWGKTLAVIGASGGVGSTTISCYLAMSLAEASGTRAAIIDLDLEFGTVASLWDVNPRYTIGDLATAGAVDTLLIEDAIIDLPCSVAILPRPAQMDQAQAIHEGIVKSIFDAARSLYPYVIIDLPRRLDEVTGCAIQACDKLRLQLQEAVAEQWECEPSDVLFAGGMAYLAPDTKVRISFAEAVWLGESKFGTLGSTGSYNTPELGGDYRGGTIGASPAYSFTAHVAEVEVDAQTGIVEVVKIWI
ncbi:MAG: molybdopterin-dependent oxidoreductase, partial [Planctomycetota bacterium]|nr:molybdopterin-dependent oxidoreductase [Planctomycetota bacterium]